MMCTISLGICGCLPPGIEERIPFARIEAVSPAMVPDNTTLCGLIVSLPVPGLTHRLPWLPVEEAIRLDDPAHRENFIARACALHEFNQMWREGLSRGRLIAFHSRYKLVLLAHSQPEYRRLGPYVARLDRCDDLEAFAREYRLRIMTLMRNPATRNNHTNVLQHVQGYFHQLTPEQRAELTRLILAYHRGEQPLDAPLALLRHYLDRYPDSYLQQQRYLSPLSVSAGSGYGY